MLMSIEKQEIPSELITQLVHTVSKIAHRYEMAGRPKDAIRVLKSALKHGAQEMRSQDRALLMADLGSLIWKHGRDDSALAMLRAAKRLAGIVDTGENMVEVKSTIGKTGGYDNDTLCTLVHGRDRQHLFRPGGSHQPPIHPVS